MIGKICKLTWTRMSFQINWSHHLLIRGIVQVEYWLGRIFVVLVLTHVWIFAAPWIVVLQASLSFTISQSLLKLMCSESCDATQPAHPLSSPYSPAFKLSQHPGLFQWVSQFASGCQSIGTSPSASVPPVKTQHWFPLGLTSWISFQSKGLSSF